MRRKTRTHRTIADRMRVRSHFPQRSRTGFGSTNPKRLSLSLSIPIGASGKHSLTGFVSRRVAWNSSDTKSRQTAKRAKTAAMPLHRAFYYDHDISEACATPRGERRRFGEETRKTGECASSNPDLNKIKNQQQNPALLLSALAPTGVCVIGDDSRFGLPRQRRRHHRRRRRRGRGIASDVGGCGRDIRRCRRRIRCGGRRDCCSQRSRSHRLRSDRRRLTTEPCHQGSTEERGKLRLEAHTRRTP
mmetsp:Transcript_2779/g.7632  ORF Transcript_2779/g.7632 Transcript_2779/m.7632 type:complete len:246 (+) Transcript_2779:127-864(+)